METCVLIPQELSLAVTAAGARNSAEQSVSVWSSMRIKQGEMYYPFQGTVRIDKLNIYSYVSDDDVSTEYFLIEKSDGEKKKHKITKNLANIKLIRIFR